MIGIFSLDHGVHFVELLYGATVVHEIAHVHSAAVYEHVMKLRGFHQGAEQACVFRFVCPCAVGVEIIVI